MNALYNEYPFMAFGEFSWIFVVVILAIAWYLFQSRRKKTKKRAQTLLDEQYDKGEISLEEYEEKSKSLGKKRQ